MPKRHDLKTTLGIDGVGMCVRMETDENIQRLARRKVASNHSLEEATAAERLSYF